MTFTTDHETGFHTKTSSVIRKAKSRARVWPGRRANRRLTAEQVTTSAIVADVSSAHPDQPGDCGLALSAFGSGLTLPRGR